MSPIRPACYRHRLALVSRSFERQIGGTWTRRLALQCRTCAQSVQVTTSAPEREDAADGGEFYGRPFLEMLAEGQARRDLEERERQIEEHRRRLDKMLRRKRPGA